MQQLVTRNIRDFGMTQGAALTLMTIVALIGVFGSWIIGVIDQKIGTKKTMQFFGIWYACALLCNFTNTKAGFWISIIMIGIGIGGSANFTTSLPASVFGRQGYDKVNSVLFPIQGIITAMTFAINGFVMNMTGGNVRYAYIIDACLAVINVLLIVFFVKDHKYNKDWQAGEAAKAK